MIEIGPNLAMTIVGIAVFAVLGFSIWLEHRP